MSRTWLRPFYAACGVLLLLIAWAWVPTSEPAPVLPPPRPVHSGPVASPTAAEPDYDQMAQTVLARPLFTIGRRPHREAMAAGRVAAEGVPRLSGIMITPAGRHAIFSPEGGKPLVLAVGGTVGDHTIRAIDSDGVVLDGIAQKLHPTLDRQHAATLTPNMFMPGFQPQPFNPQGFTPNNFPPAAQAQGNDDQNDAAPTPPTPPGLPFRGPIVPRGRE